MFDKQALEYLFNQSAAGTTMVGGRSYFMNQNGLQPVLDPTPHPIKVTTLTGIADYLKNHVDALNHPVFAHVASHDSVMLCSNVFGPWGQRMVHISASPIPIDRFSFGQYMEVEDFIVGLQSKFVMDENLNQVLIYVASISEETVQTVTDDRVAQVVTVRKGAVRKENAEVPNPVTLRAYRTFLEIDQPSCDYVLRLKTHKGNMPLCALFEGDGGAWKQKAILDIADWLKGELPELVVIA